MTRSGQEKEAPPGETAKARREKGGGKAFNTEGEGGGALGAVVWHEANCRKRGVLLVKKKKAEEVFPGCERKGRPPPAG